MEFSKEELLEAKRQIDFTLHKLREVVKTLEAKENAARYKPQITLAERRTAAFALANALIERELTGLKSDVNGRGGQAETEKPPL